MLRWKYSRPLLGVLLLVLAIAPLFTSLPLGKPGLQQTLAVAFIWGALALTYDLLFGFTGLLSFGHALYFATGVYVSCILINKEIVSWWLAAIIATVASGLLAALVGAASLRTTGITFAMVTLAQNSWCNSCTWLDDRGECLVAVTTVDCSCTLNL